MHSALRHFFLGFAAVGVLIAGYFLFQAHGVWSQAMVGGGRQVLFSWLLITLSITCGLGHLVWGQRVTEGQGHQQTAGTRMYQWELGVFQLLIALVAMCFDATQLVPLAWVWGAFLVLAGLRHALKKEPISTVVGDVLCGGLLLAVCVAS